MFPFYGPWRSILAVFFLTEKIKRFGFSDMDKFF